MVLKSSAYPEGGTIPVRYTCDGDDVSPPLSWEDAPAKTESFALILHDPDAPKAGGFTHWVLYDMDSTFRQINENIPKQGKIAGLGVQGKNDSSKVGYMGPCPPSGTHRYIAKLFALDVKLNLAPGASQGEVEGAMKAHVVETATLTGEYARSK